MIQNPFLAGFSRTLIMGIVNVSPDSFSGDGIALSFGAADAACRMAEEGADILDIGGESSRPGAEPVGEEEEIRRVIPAVEAIKSRLPTAVISVDTVKSRVAALALEAGASIINDISGGLADPLTLPLAARSGAGVVLMHNRSERGAARSTERIGGEYLAPEYADVVADVSQELSKLAATATEKGISRDRIVLDPGIGFGKTVEQNLRLINRLDKIAEATGYPLLVGASRKSFIGRILDKPIEQRMEGNAAVVAACVLRRAAIVRVHDVKEMALVAKMAGAILSA